MKTTVLLLLILISTFAFAQQVPQPTPITTARVLAEHGQCAVLLSLSNEDGANLRQLVAQLQAENKELKAKCKDLCEDKK